jgi:polyhydroxybutyrate depolymerase
VHDGLMREFLIHVPPTYDNTRAVSLVVNFHGATSNADQQRSLFSKMNTTADAKGFIVVYPQGVGDSWNAGACCGDAVTQNVDDVGFARALVKHMEAHACIDTKRVYATGFSNGGRMSYRLGCEAADVFAAIGPVAGTKSFPDLDNTPGCQPSRPISLIDFMGSADTRIEAQAGQIKEWIGFNHCTDGQPTESFRRGEHYCMKYAQCEAGTSVTYCVIDGGGHCWPGSTPCPLGETSRAEDLSANELMWEVFERSSL